MAKIWICPFCLTHNHFPHHYADISPDNLPAVCGLLIKLLSNQQYFSTILFIIFKLFPLFSQELVGECTTIEYTLQQPLNAAPTFLFLVDTAIIDEELQQIKDSICQSLMMLPQNSLVGLITFGKNVCRR